MGGRKSKKAKADGVVKKEKQERISWTTAKNARVLQTIALKFGPKSYTNEEWEEIATAAGGIFVGAGDKIKQHYFKNLKYGKLSKDGEQNDIFIYDKPNPVKEEAAKDGEKATEDSNATGDSAADVKTEPAATNSEDGNVDQEADGTEEQTVEETFAANFDEFE